MNPLIFSILFTLHPVSSEMEHTPVFKAPPAITQYEPQQEHLVVYNASVHPQPVSLATISAKDVSATILDVTIDFTSTGRPMVSFELLYLRVVNKWRT